MDIAFVLLFQMLLYNKDFLKQLFVAVGFVTGKDLNSILYEMEVMSIELADAGRYDKDNVILVKG